MASKVLTRVENSGFIVGFIESRLEHMLGTLMVEIPIDTRRIIMRKAFEEIAESRDIDVLTVYELMNRMWDGYHGEWFEHEAGKVMLYLRLMGVERGISDSVRHELERDVRQLAAEGFTMSEIAERLQPSMQLWRNGRRICDFMNGSIYRKEAERNQHFSLEMLTRAFYYVEQSREDFSGQNIIFLGVDGVLNCQTTQDIIDGSIGIDDDRVSLLKDMVDIMDARIVLVSLWKQRWYAYSKDRQDILASTLDERLERQGLVIADLTEDAADYWARGRGILNWIERQRGPIGRILILDDESYDYHECGLSRYHIRTSYYGEQGGLQPEHIERLRRMMPDLQYIPVHKELLDRAENHGMERERRRVVHALSEAGYTPHEIAELIHIDLQPVREFLQNEAK